METEFKKSKIHIWDARALFSAMAFAVIAESLLLAPLIIYGMGHAGPNGGGIGYLSLILNLLGIGVAVAITDDNFTWFKFYSVTFIVQALLLTYIFFVLIRSAKTKQADHLSLK